MSQATCPVCGAALGLGTSVMMHNLDHALPAEDGESGYMWRCGCGEADGVWDNEMGAAAGLTVHMQQRHGIRV
jgi:hypothetical protein